MQVLELRPEQALQRPAVPLRDGRAAGMTPAEHYEAAEIVLEKGEYAVTRIGELSDAREELLKRWGDGEAATWLTSEQQSVRDAITEFMDELGKKAMGCWAQAQVHATLATASPEHDYWPVPAGGG